MTVKMSAYLALLKLFQLKYPWSIFFQSKNSKLDLFPTKFPICMALDQLMNWQNAWIDSQCSDKSRKACNVKKRMCAKTSCHLLYSSWWQTTTRRSATQPWMEPYLSPSVEARWDTGVDALVVGLKHIECVQVITWNELGRKLELILYFSYFFTTKVHLFG